MCLAVCFFSLIWRLHTKGRRHCDFSQRKECLEFPSDTFFWEYYKNRGASYLTFSTVASARALFFLGGSTGVGVLTGSGATSEKYIEKSINKCHGKHSSPWHFFKLLLQLGLCQPFWALCQVHTFSKQLTEPKPEPKPWFWKGPMKNFGKQK